MSHPGHGSCRRGITNPIPNRLQKAASNAVRLSGNDIGNINATSTAPKIRPHNKATARRDMRELHGVSGGASSLDHGFACLIEFAYDVPRGPRLRCAPLGTTVNTPPLGRLC